MIRGDGAWWVQTENETFELSGRWFAVELVGKSADDPGGPGFAIRLSVDDRQAPAEWRRLVERRAGHLVLLCRHVVADRALGAPVQLLGRLEHEPMVFYGDLGGADRGLRHAADSMQPSLAG